MTKYDLTLSTSLFPAQSNVEIHDITVGGLLREVAANIPEWIFMESAYGLAVIP